MSKVCPRCFGWGEISYFGDSQVTCPACMGRDLRRVPERFKGEGRQEVSSDTVGSNPTPPEIDRG